MAIELASGEVHSLVLDLLKNYRAGKVLDIGCGQGVLAQKLKDFDVYGCDKHDDAPAKLKYSKLNINSDFPYADSYFDYVTAVEVIEHVQNHWHFIEEISRIIKPGGRAIITTPNIQHLQFRLYYLLTGLIGSFKPIDIIKFGHINPIYLPVLEHILKENSFEINQVAYNRNWLYYGVNKKIYGNEIKKDFSKYEYGLKIPGRNKYFGQIVVIEVTKHEKC